MPIPRVTVGTFFERYGSKLGLDWVSGDAGVQRLLVPPTADITQISLVGHLNFIHPHRIQVLGSSEFAYLEGLGKNSYDDALDALFGTDSSAVIISDGFEPTSDLSERAAASDIALMRSPLSADRLIDYASYYLSSLLADTHIVHGVLMEVMGIGVLLTGHSAIGKSELALELISRGHRLVADDAPEFIRVAPDTVRGSCPALLQDFLEVRGLGVLNIRAMFGDTAIKNGKNLRLVVDLMPPDERKGAGGDRLQGQRMTRTLLDVEVPQVRLPVAPGRNLAVLVEAAAQDQILRYGGYDAAEDFAYRQRAELQESK